MLTCEKVCEKKIHKTSKSKDRSIIGETVLATQGFTRKNIDVKLDKNSKEKVREPGDRRSETLIFLPDSGCLACRHPSNMISILILSFGVC